MTTALNAYGFVGALANAIPELRAKFEQAAREEWPAERFQREVQDTGWWKTNSDAARRLYTLQVTDPATYSQNMANAADKITLMAQQMGRAVTNPNLALNALLFNWDDEQIKHALTFDSHVVVTGENTLMGDAAQLDNHLRQVAASYGVAYTDQSVRDFVTKAQRGEDSIDGWTSLMQARAKASYPQFAQQIDAGMTVRDIADPYIATMAKTLEVADSSINLDDPNIRKAMSQRNPDGTVSSAPLWQFERTLKDDPRYDKTKQARDGAASMLHEIGKSFGFAS